MSETAVYGDGIEAEIEYFENVYPVAQRKGNTLAAGLWWFVYVFSQEERCQICRRENEKCTH